MPKRKIAVLINPHSAGGRAVKVWPAYREQLIATGYAISAHNSRSEADFRAQVRKFAQRFAAIGVCGGDSSLTIAAEELLAVGFRGTLAFLPAGSANDIVLDIREQRGIGKSKKQLYLAQLTTGESKKIFIGQANWGLGVAVNRHVGALLERAPWLRPLTNLCGFLAIVVTHLLRRDVTTVTIATESEKINGVFSVVLATQIRHWASGLRFAPIADWYAPEFTLVTIRRCNLVRLLRIIAAARSASHLQFPEVAVYRARQLRLDFATPQPVQVDGDIVHDSSGKEYKSTTYMLKKQSSRFVLAALP